MEGDTMPEHDLPPWEQPQTEPPPSTMPRWEVDEHGQRVPAGEPEPAGFRGGKIPTIRDLGDTVVGTVGRQIRQHADRLAVDEILDQLAGDVRATAQFTASTRDSITAAVRARAARRMADRPAEIDDAGDLRVELVGLADDAEVLDRLAGSFTEGAKVARALAGDVMAELPEKRGKPQRTAHVGDGQGSRLTVTTSQRTKAFAEVDTIVEIVGTAAIGWGARTDAELDPLTPLAGYALGIRDGMAALLAVLASPKVKTTALDELRARLQDAGEDDLAKRLRKSYGRRDVGEPSVKIDRAPLDDDTEEKV